jgi:two-component system CheB/CheR fusion protein
MGYVTGISGDGVAKAVVAHVDITAQKSVEEQMRIINEGLESRVIERTFELQAAVDALEAEMAQRQRLEREVIEIGEHEKERVGQDLHDGLCQALSGIGLTTKSLLRKLESQSLPLAVVAAEVKRILDLIRDATDEARIVALGLYPVDIEEYGLAMALKKLAQDTEYHFDIECHCQCGTSVVLPDHYTAAHVYRIAQEAVSNAIKHGKADSVLITIAATGDLIILKIKDNGHGRLEELRETGMGLKTMKYRARALGGSLDLQQCPQRGLVVTCSFPNQSKPEA